MHCANHRTLRAWLLVVLTALSGRAVFPAHAADPATKAAPTTPAQAKGEYADPDGLFAIRLPAGFKAQRERSEIGMSTILTKEGDPPAAVPRIEFITLTGGSAIDPTHLEQMGADLTDVFISIMNEDGEVLSQKTSKVRVAGKDAMRCDMEFKTTKEGAVQAGYVIVTMHDKSAVMVAVSAPKADTEAMKMLEASMASLVVGK